MPEDATLKDVTVEPNPSDSPKEQVVAAKATDDIKVVDAEAAEIGRIMLDSGYTKEKINQVLEAPAALNSLRYLINNNPQEFLNLLERTDPATGEKFLENMADTYVKRYAPKGDTGAKGGKEADASLMNEIAAMREELTGLRTAEQQRQNAATLAQISARYNARVDDLFSQLPKDLALTKSEKTAMRAQLDKELGADQSVVQRVNNGNFVDVPNRFKSIVEGWASDRKASAQEAKEARERAERGSFADFPSGAQPFMVDVPAGAADSWDATEEAFAAGLTKASR